MLKLIYNDLQHYLKISGIGLFIDPGFYCILTYRIGHSISKSQFKSLNPLWYAYKLVYVFQLFILKIELPHSVVIGKNFFLAHPYGLVIGGNTIIGDNVKIGPWVVIGHNFDKKNPVIGNNCYIAPHSCILGGISIGDNSIIGAGSIVTRDIQEGSVVYVRNIEIRVKTPKQ